MSEQSTTQIDTSAPLGELALVVIAGTASPLHYTIAEGESVTIGRAALNDVVVENESLSRHHAKLLTSPTLRIVDLQSVNGIRLEGERLESGVPVPLPLGRVVQLGDVAFVVYPIHGDRSAAAGIGEGRVVVNEAMKALYELAGRIAPSELSVLITGETGVGKELVAGYVHAQSKRADGPLLRLNCGAIADNLVESELFGHEEGAFTGATKSMPGLLESATGGTVFLDEIGDLQASAQAKLLRALESREVRRVGGRTTRKIDVRFVAATHHDLKAEASEGRFREDLYFRLNGITLHVPPLRSRRDEIETLAKAFVRRYAEGAIPVIDEDALQTLRIYDWPGNVRELRNVMERATVLAQDGRISTDCFPDELRADPRESVGSSLKAELEAIEKQRIVDALAACDGNQTRAAEMLGLARRTLVKRLDEYQIARPRKRNK